MSVHTYIRPRPHKDGTEAFQITVDYGRLDTLVENKIVTRRPTKSHTVVGTYQQALKEAGRLQAEAEGNNPFAPYKKTKSITLEAWNERFINSFCGNVEESTRFGYRELLSYCKVHPIGQVAVSRLSQPVLQDFLDGLQVSSPKNPEKGLSTHTIRHIQMALHRSLGVAVKQGYATFNAAEGLYLPRRESHEAQHYERDELVSILEAAKEEAPRIRLLVTLFATTGIRRGEGCGLRFSDIDFKANEVHICHNRVRGDSKVVVEKPPKSKNGLRTITIPADLKQLIRKEKKRRTRSGLPALYVLANDSGLPYNPDTISKLWRDFLSRHPDIRPLNLHALRHSQMCAMIELGIAPAVAAARLGDTVATAMTAYSHSSRPKEQAAAALLEKALSR